MATTAISRSNAEALIPEEVTADLFKEIPQNSAIMQLGRKLPNMSRGTTRMPVLSGLVTGGFVDGDTGLKATSNTDWQNKYLVAGEIAVIVPIPENVIDDADYDIWDEVRPQVAEEFGRVFDAAVIHGTGKPPDWPTAIVPAAVAAGHSVDLSNVEAADGDLYDALLSPGGVLSKIEEDGYTATGHIAALSMKAKLRGLREKDADGNPTGSPIFMRAFNGGQNVQEQTRYELDGEPIIFPKNGSIDPSVVLDIAGDWTKLVWAMRQDITYKILTEAVITDAAGTIVYNLAQQDMVAMRCKMRLAWQLPNPINRVNPNPATRYPFAILVP
jgi:HK97 family phage major capsid protein